MSINSFFQENGFYHAKGVFTPQEILKLETSFDSIVRQLIASNEDINARWQGEAMDKMDANRETTIFHTHNVQQYDSTWINAFLHPRFLEVTTEILGENIVLHHSKLFQKPPEKGSPFPMHQDWEYFPTIKDSMIAGIIHVSDATDAMGCLRVYAGSHKLGRVLGTTGATNSSFLDSFPIEAATPIEAKAGDVIFFHYFTLHASMPNRSSNARKTVLVQMHSGSDSVEEGIEHPNERLVLKGWNQHMTRNKANQLK